jgi:hypothetical protein
MTTGGALGIGGTTSADFGAVRSFPMTTGGALGIGGTTSADLGASGWLFAAGLFAPLATAERRDPPFAAS